MIDKHLIESARSIRREYISLSNSLTKYQDDVRKLSEFLLKKVDDLKKYNDEVIKKRTTTDIQLVTNHLLLEIQSIEDEEQKLVRKVEVVNKSLEKLQKEELVLYNKIKDKYPDLSDESIIKEIHSQLDQ